MKIKNNISLSGYLVGIGKNLADGSTEYKTLDKPVKNIIVKQGLNDFMMFEGSSGVASNNNNLRFEFLAYCRYGSSNTPTDFATTSDLVLPIGSTYTTPYKQNWPWFGTYRGSSYGLTKNRVTHLSVAASLDTEVKEIGYYHRYGGVDHLFSRVVLPSTFYLRAGESLITTYEFVVNINTSEMKALTSLHDSGGALLEGRQKMIIAGSNGGAFTIPCINQTGGSTVLQRLRNAEANNGLAPLLMPASDMNYQSGDSNFFRYTENVVNDFPNSWATLSMNTSTIVTQEQKYQPNYIIDSFTRDVNITCPQFWPSMTDYSQYRDIYAIQFLSSMLLFGHTVDDVWVPTPWRKFANKTANFVMRQSVATAESIDWLNNP